MNESDRALARVSEDENRDLTLGDGALLYFAYVMLIWANCLCDAYQELRSIPS